VSTETVRNCIEDKDRTKTLRDVMVAGTSQYGTQTFDQSLYYLLKQGIITETEAMKRATNIGEFKLRIEGVTPTAGAAQSSMEQTVNVQSGSGRGNANAPSGGREAAVQPPPAANDVATTFADDTARIPLAR